MTNAVLARPPMLNPWIVAARGGAVDVFDQALSLRGRPLDQGELAPGSVGALIPIVSAMSPVQIGVFSDGWVQVTGSAVDDGTLKEGVNVVVPA